MLNKKILAAFIATSAAAFGIPVSPRALKALVAPARRLAASDTLDTAAGQSGLIG